MSAQKTLQGSETETRELLEEVKENNIFPDFNLPSRQINDIEIKKQTKIELGCQTWIDEDTPPSRGGWGEVEAETAEAAACPGPPW